MVQNAHQILMSEKSRGVKLSTFSKRASEIAEMKYALIERLEKMDRTKVDFFPPGSFVQYVHPYYSQKEKCGRVLEHVDEMCLCQFDGDDFQVKVDPIHLKLRFIRSTYQF